MYRRLNRQLAVQALYAFAIGGAPIQEILDQMRIVLEPDEERNALVIAQHISPSAPTPDEEYSWRQFSKKGIKTLQVADSFVRELCQRTCDHLQYIDDKLAHAVEHWKPERLQQVDRAILRLAACEILYYADIDARVTINEYIEIAKEFEVQSPAFINGVLNELLAKNLKPPTSDDAGGQS